MTQWVSSHSGLLLMPDTLDTRTPEHQENPKASFCRICNEAVDEERLEKEGSLGIEVRVFCRKPYHKGTGAKDEHALGIRRESDTETTADLLRLAAAYPWFHQGELPVTARRFYDPDAGGRPE